MQGQRVGVVLSGGGAAGLAHIGVLQALEDNGVPIDHITGSSMGALIGALYAAGLSPAQMDSLFRTELYHLMAEGGVEPRYQYWFKNDAPDASMITLRFDLNTPFTASLPTNLRDPVLLDFEQMRTFAPVAALAGYSMDSLFVSYRCVASDITAQRPVVFRTGDLAQAVRASMSYPFYFKPIRVDGHVMMDGGLYNNFPSDVMYHDFMPDFMIGSNVASTGNEPSEDDLLSQLRAMMQGPTDFSLRCDESVIIEPRTTTSLFDFTNTGRTVADGYQAALERMPEILAEVGRRVSPEEVAQARASFRAKLPPLVFRDVEISGLTPSQERFVRQTLPGPGRPFTADVLKPAYFRLHADPNIAFIHPRAVRQPGSEWFDLHLTVKPEKDLEVRFGGMVSSRPINTGMAALRYNLLGRSSLRLDARSYFGKFYTAGQVRLRADLATRQAIYVEPIFTLNRWDHFRSFTTFFEEVRPSFIVVREAWGGMDIGIGMGNKGVLVMDARVVETVDRYYQTSEFTSLDTSDVTVFRHYTSGIRLERNSLNRKQHANAGDRFRMRLRFVSGDEHTDPGSTQVEQQERRVSHEWMQANVLAEKYFLSRGTFRFGLMAEGSASAMPAFQNYTASVIRSPAFQPTPESLTRFIEEFRSPTYLAVGARSILSVARNRFDLRLEGYVFQPYEPFVRGDLDQTETAPSLTQRYYIGSGSLIYQSPIGPVWFNLSYFDGLREPWVWSLNFGYVIFNQRATD